MFSGRGLGLPPRRFWFSTLRSHSMLFTLLRPLSLPGLPGGFQVAATGYEKVSTCEVHPILMAVRKLIGNIHVVALWRPWFLLRDEAEKSATHDGSAYGLVSGFAVRFVFALRPSFGLRPSFLLRWVACALGARPSVSCAHGLSFSMALLSCGLVTRFGDRFTAVDQGEKAHAGVFKSSPSRMSDELTGTCRSQECSWQLDAGYSDIV